MGSSPPISLSFAGSSATNSPLKGDLTFGDIIAGGRKIPQWVLLTAMGIALLLGTALILRPRTH